MVKGQAVRQQLLSIVLVSRLVKQKETGVNWVFKKKYNSDAFLDKHKSWLVAKGYA